MNDSNSFSKSMRVFAALAVSASMLTSAPANACSAFSFIDGSKTFVAKNYDWIPFHEHGAVFVNKRGLAKKAETLRTKNAAEWISKYGSVTFSQIGREFPASGMNEAGLSAEILQMPETVYIDETDPRPAANEAQWLQYQLDNFSTLAEVTAHMTDLRVEQAFIGAHYFICDKSGACGAFEYMNGKLVVFSGETLEPRVLTNNFFEESVATLKGMPLSPALIEGSKSAKSKMSPLIAFFANTAHSIARFAIAAKFLEKRAEAKTPPEDFAFDALNKVEVAGLLRTQWSLVYNLTDRAVTFRTRSNSSLKKLSLDGLDFSCATPALMADVQQAEGGDIRSRLMPNSKEANRKLTEENWMILSSGLRNLAAEYPDKNTHCVRP